MRHETRAWLLRGVSVIMGSLHLESHRLSFRTANRGTAWGWQLRKLERNAPTPDLAARLRAGQPCVVFEEPVDAIRVSCPWYYFNGGLIVTTVRDRYRLSFGPPPSATRGTGADGLVRIADDLQSIPVMRSVGKRWLYILRVCEKAR